MELLEEHRCFDGQQQRWRHHSPCPELRHDVQHFFTPLSAKRRRRCCTGCRG